MRYVIIDSPDPREINKFFDADIAPRIGHTFHMRGDRVYRVIDVELIMHEFTEGRGVRALVKRMH